MVRQKNVKIVKKSKKMIPIFFATDDNYVPFLGVAIKSLLDNASKFYDYKIHILTEGLKEENKIKLKKLEREYCKIDFVDLTEHILRIKERLNSMLRDYYTASIFYRLFIAAMYPQYKKVIYLDCDIVVLDDISKFFNINLGDNILGACTDDVINSCEEFKIYARDGVGVDYTQYFNSGVLLMNLDAYRKNKIKERFVYLMIKHNFETAAPDQDYLNVLCKNKVLMIEKGWDKMSIDENYDGKLHLIHYNNFRKPWYFDDVPYEKYFWQYAKTSDFYDEILNIKKNFTPEMAEAKATGAIGLVEMTKRIVTSENNFNKVLNKR